MALLPFNWIIDSQVGQHTYVCPSSRIVFIDNVASKFRRVPDVRKGQIEWLTIRFFVGKTPFPTPPTSLISKDTYVTGVEKRQHALRTVHYTLRLLRAGTLRCQLRKDLRYFFKKTPCRIPKRRRWPGMWLT